MLAIRMQRTGRKGHAQYRVVVQDSRLTPTSGRTVAMLGSYNPHTKMAIIEKDKAVYYLNNGAQPSERVVSVFKREGVALPKWVKQPDGTKKRTIRHADKLRRNQPKQEAQVQEAPVQETIVAPSGAEVEDEKTPETPTEK